MKRLGVGAFAIFGIAGILVCLGNRDPLHELAQFEPTMERRLIDSYGEPPTLIWERRYTFPGSSLALYEYLEEHQSGQWGRVAFANRWSGEYDPVKRVLTVRENVGFSWWDNLKERFGFGQQGCG